MDSTHQIWQSAAMNEALARGDAGAIVRLARRAADITLAELGRQVGYTAASLSRMERGKQPMRDVVLLRKLASCLNIAPHLLGLASRSHQNGEADPARTTLGRQDPPFDEKGSRMRRRALLGALAAETTALALQGPDAAAHAPAKPSLSALEDLLLHRKPLQHHRFDPTESAVSAAVTASRQEFSACRYDVLARVLPSRIALAQAFGAEGHQEAAATAVAELYATATRLCIKLDEDGLAAVTADRALTFAFDGADPLMLAEAHRMVSSVWRRQGHYGRATDVAVGAAQSLAAERVVDASEHLSVQGNLYATAAYTAAKQGDRDSARALIEEAEATAAQLGRDALQRGTVFGPGQVLLHQVSISHLLGDAGQAIEYARRIDPAALPTTERQARYWIDIARAYEQWGKPERCYRALLAAERAAPQEVRRSAVRVMAEGLMRHDRSLAGIRTFARRVGASV